LAVAAEGIQAFSAVADMTVAVAADLTVAVTADGIGIFSAVAEITVGVDRGAAESPQFAVAAENFVAGETRLLTAVARETGPGPSKTLPSLRTLLGTET
jgi:hypothetical protein